MFSTALHGELQCQHPSPQGLGILPMTLPSMPLNTSWPVRYLLQLHFTYMYPLQLHVELHVPLTCIA